MHYKTMLLTCMLIAMAAPANAQERKARGLRYTAPKGWVMEMKPSFISVATLTVGGTKVTATPLRKSGAAYVDYRAMNVNRWRQQIGLPAAMKGDVAKVIMTIKVDKQDSDYIDLVGKEKRILAVITMRGDQAWFFKMIGPPAEVAKHKAGFEEFIASLKIAMAPG